MSHCTGTLLQINTFEAGDKKRVYTKYFIPTYKKQSASYLRLLNMKSIIATQSSCSL